MKTSSAEPRPRIAAGAGLWRARRLDFAILPSTNLWALEHGSELRHGDIVWTSVQTAGRGRLGRVWISAGAGNLTLTVILERPRVRRPLPNLGQAAALAVRRLLALYGLSALVKWPNDVLLAGKKIAGILLETRGDCLALGIGLNVNFTPGQIRAAVDGAATSLAIELRRRLSREAVFQRLRTELENGLAAYTARGLPALLAEWRLHDALRGCAIAVESAGTTVRGRYRGLDAEGCLCLSDSRGRLRTFWAGDVTRILTRRLPEGAHKLRLGTRRAKVAEHESGRSEKDKPEIRPALTARVRSGNARPRWRPCSPNPRR